MSDTLDDVTPREVWLEYERRKRGLFWMPPSEYEQAITRLGEELGLGVDPLELTGRQRRARLTAITRHR